MALRLACAGEVASSLGEVSGEALLPCMARRAASWRRAREGGMLSGGGMGAGCVSLEMEAGGSSGGEKMERAEREEGA